MREAIYVVRKKGSEVGVIRWLVFPGGVCRALVRFPGYEQYNDVENLREVEAEVEREEERECLVDVIRCP